MQLIACQQCHAQYDTTDIDAPEFPCRCGNTLLNRQLAGIDAKILRCGSCGAGVSETDEACAYCASPIVRDPRKLSLICPECYARNCDDARFCTACGVGFQPEAAHVDGYDLDCPACSASMPPHHIGGIGLNECSECSGLWVPSQNFDQLVNRAIDAHRQHADAGYAVRKTRVAGANPTRQTVVYRRCPECNEMMSRRNFRGRSGVVIDICPVHGTWLDTHELEQIAGYILSGGKRPDEKVPGAPVTSIPRSQTPLHGEPDSAPSTAQFSDRTRQVLAEQKARRERNLGADAARSVLGFLGTVLNWEIR